jgi:DNA invertase Pin-like site-specific DNA recombinase
LARTVAFLVLILVGFLLLYLLLRRRIESRTDASALLAQVRNEVDRIIVELNQTTDRNVSLLEDRLASLADLLAQADKKIGLLRRESEKHDTSTQIYSRILQRRPAAEASGGREGAEQKGEEAPRKPEELREQVLRLHAAGLSASMIARRLGITLAEIDLIVSLAGRRG